ncbi:MAG: glutamate-cysteine ligase family protein [bacterium]
MDPLLHLFQGYGVELEYMIVHKEDLKVFPIADRILYSKAGAYVSEIEMGQIAWSNELALHVIELKTNGPAKTLERLPDLFDEQVRAINHIAKTYGARLLPTGAHPMMLPCEETILWPHEDNPIYSAYNRIFDCRGHGWSNVQSTHLNLPFAHDEEFGRLHAAVRLILPLIPALSASTPILDGRATGFLDTRLYQYIYNQKRIPSITGKIIPERIFTQRDYEEVIFRSMYADIAPYDKEGILQHEWLNSRGAIPRFSRNSIEIRLIDIQECPCADCAIIAAIVATLKAIIAERWLSFERQKAWHEERLAALLHKVIERGEEAVIDDREYLSAFGLHAHSCHGKELWAHIIENVFSEDERKSALLKIPLTVILQRGTLATRILNALGKNFSKEDILDVYRRLADCAESGQMFLD